MIANVDADEDVYVVFNVNVDTAEGADDGFNADAPWILMRMRHTSLVSEFILFIEDKW